MFFEVFSSKIGDPHVFSFSGMKVAEGYSIISNLAAFLKNWDSLYARLNSYFEATSYKKKKHEKIKAYSKSL